VLLVNYPQWCDRAEIFGKGTNRSQFLRGAGGQVQLGGYYSSYLLNKSMPHFYGRNWNQPPPSKENRHLAAKPPAFIC